MAKSFDLVVIGMGAAAGVASRCKSAGWKGTFMGRWIRRRSGHLAGKRRGCRFLAVQGFTDQAVNMKMSLTWQAAQRAPLI